MIKMVYRNTLQIIGDILEVAHEHGMEGAKTYQGFVTKLLHTGLLNIVQLDMDSRAYVLTEKGRQYLNKYEEFESLVSSLGLVSS
jgi:predicted transcriptional regulator